MPDKIFYKTDYLYTPLFCEENIWQLIHSLISEDIAINKLWCLFITNPGQKVPLLNQQAAAPNQLVIWDYHVVLLADYHHQLLIFDFDTRLDFATPLDKYLRSTFIFSCKENGKEFDTRLYSYELPEELIPYIRKIPAESYLKHFYSDRSHMLKQIPASEFPPWPVINENRAHCIPLADYLNIKSVLNDNSLLIKVDSFAAVKQKLSNSFKTDKMG